MTAYLTLPLLRLFMLIVRYSFVDKVVIQTNPMLKLSIFVDTLCNLSCTLVSFEVIMEASMNMTTLCDIVLCLLSPLSEQICCNLLALLLTAVEMAGTY
jgi:hypothetical protein